MEDQDDLDRKTKYIRIVDEHSVWYNDVGYFIEGEFITGTVYAKITNVPYKMYIPRNCWKLITKDEYITTFVLNQ